MAVAELRYARLHCFCSEPVDHPLFFHFSYIPGPLETHRTLVALTRTFGFFLGLRLLCYCTSRRRVGPRCDRPPRSLGLHISGAAGGRR